MCLPLLHTVTDWLCIILPSIISSIIIITATVEATATQFVYISAKLERFLSRNQRAAATTSTTIVGNNSLMEVNFVRSPASAAEQIGITGEEESERRGDCKSSATVELLCSLFPSSS
jgi:hypothetical protein